MRGRRSFPPLEGTDGNDESRLSAALGSFFGFSSFRGAQKEVCLNVMRPGSQTVCLLPTGAGKSLCFQLPAVCLGGVTLVVSPLISLMTDQTEALRKLCQASSDGRVACDFYSSNSAASEKTRIKALLGKAREQIVDARKSYILYVTPEFLDLNLSLVSKLASDGALSLIGIDEAHCVIEYGTDFRPTYLKLGVLVGLGRGVRVIALTASVSDTMLKDMMRSLNMEHATVFRSSFNRTNIFYEVHYTETLENEGTDETRKKVRDVLNWINTSEDRRGQSGIVYVRSKADCDVVTSELKAGGSKAETYHASVSDKGKVQERWMKNETQVVVATTAFGMGIDKSDVRFVVNFNITSNMAEFYQMSGRAGRDSKQSFSLCFYGRGDASTMAYLVSQDDLNDKRSGRNVDPADMTPQERADREKKMQAKIGELQVVLKYLSTTKCRRVMILEYFGENNPSSTNCKSCDYCLFPKKVRSLINSCMASDMTDKFVRGPPRPDGSIYPREDDVDRKTNSSHTGGGFKSSRELMQGAAEERIAKRLKDMEAGVPVATAAAAAPSATNADGGVINQKARERAIDFLTKVILKNLELFNVEDLSNVPKWAVREENEIYKACKQSNAAYKGRLLALSGIIKKKQEPYVYVKPKKT